MIPGEIFWNGSRGRRSGTSWLIPLAMMVFWVAVTAMTLWELGTLAPTFRRLAAAKSATNGDQREVVAARPKPLLFWRERRLTIVDQYVK